MFSSWENEQPDMRGLFEKVQTLLATGLKLELDTTAWRLNLVGSNVNQPL